MNDRIYSYNSDGTISFQYNGEDYQCYSSIPRSDLEESKFSLSFLGSSYYQSEDDIHSVYLRKKEKCVGVIIPLSFLSEKDDEIINNVKPFFLKYADLGIRMILSLDFIKLIDEYDFSIDDLFPPNNNLSVLVFDKSLLTQDEFMEGLASLYDAGYCYVKDPLKEETLYVSELRKCEVEEKKRKKEVKIFIDSNSDYLQNKSFYKELFINILPYNTNPLYRYIMLYQTIEIFSSYASYNKFIDASEKYSNKQISKNDLREKIQESGNEKQLINKVYENLNSSGGYYDTFKQLVTSLFDVINYEHSTLHNYGDFMYAMRNRIVHENRSLVEHLDKMKEIVDLYEKTTIELIKKCDKLKMSSKKIIITE